MIPDYSPVADSPRAWNKKRTLVTAIIVGAMLVAAAVGANATGSMSTPKSNAIASKVGRVSASGDASPSYAGVREAQFLSVGDYVVLKSYYGGYIKDDGDGSVSTGVNPSGTSYGWNVEAGYNSASLKFRNEATGMYLKGTDGSGLLVSEAVTGSGRGASWLKDTSVFAGTEAKARAYGQLRSAYFTGRCVSVTSTTSTNVKVETCVNNQKFYFTFEIVA